MELVNARRSRTVLTSGIEGAIIVAVGRVTLNSRYLAQELGLSQPRVLEVLPDSQLHQHNLSTCLSRLGGAPDASYTSIGLLAHSHSSFSSHFYPTVL